MANDSSPEFEILREDGPLLALNKPAGLLTLGAIPGVPTLERLVKQYLKDKYQKPGNVYLGIPHRLDRPVSGVVVFGRNSKVAARLAEQFRNRQVRKIYWALVEQPPATACGELVDWLLKSPDSATVSRVPPETPGAREARLRYQVLDARSVCLNEFTPADHGGAETQSSCADHGWTLLEIEPLTGRTHQIRVQLAGHGCPIVGDLQYGATTRLEQVPQADPRDTPIALHARSLTLRHPIRYDELTVTAPLPAYWRAALQAARTIPIEDEPSSS
ncbi:MAG: RluA family pseudouridine synthase, partial [Planctomycetes bacterium]|nr:RluA family pseudouridine synthase [Planctomycetota bacterium]